MSNKTEQANFDMKLACSVFINYKIKEYAINKIKGLKT